MRAIEQDFSIEDINGINDRPFTADDDEDGKCPIHACRLDVPCALTRTEDEEEDDDDEYAYEDDFPRKLLNSLRFMLLHPVLTLPR